MEHSGMSAHHCPACQAYLAGIRYQAMMPNLRAEMAGGGGSDGALSPDKPKPTDKPVETAKKPLPDWINSSQKSYGGIPTLPGW